MIYYDSVPPQTPQEGDFWVSTQTVAYQLFVYRNQKWHFVCNLNTFTEITDPNQVQPVDGEIYIDTQNSRVYIGIGGNLQEIYSGV